jgi:PAS domain S-box-containing protein
MAKSFVVIFTPEEDMLNIIETQDNFRLLAENVTDVIWKFDIKGKLIYSNQSLEKILGYSSKEILKLTINELLSSGSRKKFKDLVSGLSAQNNKKNVKFKNKKEFKGELIHKNGSILKTNLKLSLLLDDDGKPNEILSIVDLKSDKNRKTSETDQSQKDWQETFDAVLDVVVLISPEHEIIQLNKVGYGILGKEPGEQIGKKCFEVFHGTDRPIEDCPCEKALKTKKACESEFNQDGRFYIATASPIFNEAGEPEALAHTVKDITTRKLSEEALRESEVKFRSIVEQSSDGIILIDKKGIVREWNRAQEKITGLTAAEVINTPFCDAQYKILPDEYRSEEKYEQFKKQLMNALDTCEAKWLNRVMEREIQHPNGSMRLIQTLIFPIKSKEGNQLCGITRDITANKLAAEALFQSEEKLNILTNSLPGLISYVDSDMRYQYVNAEYEKWFGVKRHEIIGKYIWEILGKSAYDNISPFLESTRTGKIVTYEITMNHAQKGMRTNQTTIKPHFGPDKEVMGFYVLVTDITDRKRTQEQIEKSLEEKILLFRELKHRVNNNLQLLMSMVNMWIMETDIEAVRDALQEVAGVISTMALVHSEAQVDASAKRIRLKEFLRELTHGMIGIKMGGYQKITYSLDGDEIMLELDLANPLSLVANELLINAMKHAFNGRKDGHIALTLSENNGHVILSIKDNGVGISPEFDLKKVDSLGLELVSNLVEQMKGKINFEVDNGTNVIVEFPYGG